MTKPCALNLDNDEILTSSDVIAVDFMVLHLIVHSWLFMTLGFELHI